MNGIFTLIIDIFNKIEYLYTMECIRYIKYKHLRYKRKARKFFIDDKGRVYDANSYQHHRSYEKQPPNIGYKYRGDV